MDRRNSELISILKTTTSPSQFAAVVREGAQMDLTCVRAVPDALKVLDIDIPTPAINVEVDAVETYRFGTPQHQLDEDGLQIDLVLSNNHYQLRGHSSQNKAPRGKPENNDCLYEALAEAIPQLLEVSGSEFRTTLADCIEASPEIQRDIRSGKHQDLLQRGVYGGGWWRNIGTGFMATGATITAVSCTCICPPIAVGSYGIYGAANFVFGLYMFVTETDIESDFSDLFPDCS